MTEENRSSSDSERAALLVGATGLTGGHLRSILLASPRTRSVRALVRRPSAHDHPTLDERVVDFDHLDDAVFVGIDDVHCCLGTTIKTAGSQDAFRRVDLDYVTRIAQRARAAGARRFLLVSAVGADSSSGNFYLRTKGEAEAAVAACGYPEVHVFRPGVLTGNRRELRPAERVGILLGHVFTPVMLGGLRRYRPIAAATVARAMAVAAHHGVEGHHVHRNVEILRLASRPGAV
ncbi:MAG: NAD(P)H-binding protein [Acidobacteriota bacterium]